MAIKEEFFFLEEIADKYLKLTTVVSYLLNNN